MTKKKDNTSDGFCANVRCKREFVPKRANQVYCCQKCAESVAHAKHYRSHPEYHKRRTEAYRPIKKAYDLLRSTGWTQEEYNASFASQGGCCAICGRHQSEFKKALAADHQHETGRKRGLLCGACNVAIGLLGDSSYTADCARAYLKEYENDPSGR